MGLLRDLFFGDAIQMGQMSEEIARLSKRVKILEDEKKYLHEDINRRLEYIENNFMDQIAGKCYVKVVSEENLWYLLDEIKKHKKGKTND